MKSSTRAKISLATIVVSLMVGFSARADLTPGAIEAKKVFNQRCTACHSYGRGIKVGPDLKGVTARRDRVWLLKFVRSSQTVIGSGDSVAQNLFQQFKKQRMPDWTDLSEQQIASILDWFAVDGPEQKEPDERNAAMATDDDIATARGLFSGRIPLANGGMACGACHTIGTGDEAKGGTLGPDLSRTYLRFHDRALTLYLKHPCSPRAPERAEYLTPQESFALKAYMRRAALAQRSGAATASNEPSGSQAHAANGPPAKTGQ